MSSAITADRLGLLRGREVYDRNGDKIGKIGQIYADVYGQPAWASAHTGLFGLKESLVPLYGASLAEDRVQIAYDKAMVKDAPNIDTDPDEPLSAEQVEQLYRHYGISWEEPGTSETGFGDRSADAAADADAGIGTGAGQPVDDAMTRSEERLQVGTEREPNARARLRKYVVTENVQTTVPVQREEVTLEREPITDANRDSAYSGRDIAESEHEVTLHAERPVAQKETVPVEQVRLGKETVTDEQTVDEEVRRERIEADLPERGSRRLD